MAGTAPNSNRNGKRALSGSNGLQQPPKMRMTRQRSRLLAEEGVAGPSRSSGSGSGSGSSQVNDNALELDVDCSDLGCSRAQEESQEYYDARSQQITQDEEFATRLQMEESRKQDGSAEQDDICPITDKHVSPFPIMDLPAELRLNIYRCCLTRPFNIILSRNPPPISLIQKPTEKEVRDNTVEEPLYTPVDISDDEDEDDVINLTSTRLRAQAAAAVQQQNPAGRLLNRTVNPIFNSVRNLTSRNPRHLARINNIRSASSTRQDTSNRDAVRTYIHAAATAPVQISSTASPPDSSTSSTNRSTQTPRPQDEDPLLIALLRTSKQIYKEARNILYSENIFSLDLSTAQPTLSGLHQRSRMQIRHLELTIPTHGDILERFAEVVRLSLRYCWGLKKFVIHMPFVLPGADGSGQSGNTTVYANAFDILRWLPQGCEVELRGNVCEEIATVVEKNARLRRSLDKVGYARRQLISSEAERAAADGS